MKKTDVFQKASKLIQEHPGSHFVMSGITFWRFRAQNMSYIRNLRIYKIRPENEVKWEKWGVENQIFSANAEKL